VATLAIQTQIDDALAAEDIVRATHRGDGRYYFCCPWSSIYQVRRPVRIGGRRLSPAQQFTFDVSGEELAEGGAFVRRILNGPFQTTTDVDYCDPPRPAGTTAKHWPGTHSASTSTASSGLSGRKTAMERRGQGALRSTGRPRLFRASPVPRSGRGVRLGWLGTGRRARR
jgi:hypothetical protein